MFTNLQDNNYLCYNTTETLARDFNSHIFDSDADNSSILIRSKSGDQKESGQFLQIISKMDNRCL